MEKAYNLAKEMLVTVITALILAMILQNFFIEPRIIPTGSMLPTIHLENRVLVNKIIYKFSKPQKGDIIVFSPPESTGKKEDFIKRVIAIEGDKIEIHNGQVFVNDMAIQEPYIYERPDYIFGPVYVPQNSLFVMGDNRNKSYDSHLWDSWLTLDRVKGKAIVIYWPIENFGRL